MLHRFMVGLCLMATVGAATAGTVTRVSVSSGGRQANDHSEGPSVSADGRYVAFTSAADNLVANDTNGAVDVFVRDRATGSTTRVSVNSAGVEGDAISRAPSISADGRYVAFESWAHNLDGEDTNHYWDAFVRDRVAGQTTRISIPPPLQRDDWGSTSPAISADGRYVALAYEHRTRSLSCVLLCDRVSGSVSPVSVSSTGLEGHGYSGAPAISANGHYVAFVSSATNLVPDDTNGQLDVFVRALATGQTRRVSVSSAGVQANRESYAPSLSADGRHVVFESYASNLVSDDTNRICDVFVWDRVTEQTRRVSVSSEGNQASGSSWSPCISGDGRFVAFASYGDGLIPDDSNASHDIFLHDQVIGRTSIVSVSNTGVQGGGSDDPSMSAEGRFIAFASESSLLVPGDTNLRPDVFMRDTNSTPAPAPPSPDDPPAPPADYSPGTLLRANLHSHTNASTNGVDHVGAPTVRELIQRACDLGLTVLGISDHAEAVNEAEWRALLNGTAPPTRVRAALRGFEWTLAESAVPGSGGNHINVFGAQGTALANTDGEGAGFGDLRSDVPSFYNWLADAPGIYGAAPVGQFNHISMDGSHFGSWALPTNARVKRLALSRMALAELAIGSHEGASGVQPQETIPDNPQEGEVQWRAALRKGWRLAPSFGADNYAGLGDGARRFHTGVYLYSTDSPGQWSAMRALAGRRTFAAQDASAEAQLYVGGYFMGCQDIPATSPVRLEVRYRPYKNPPQIDGPQATCEMWWKSGHKVLTGTAGWDGQYFLWRAALRATGRGNWVYAKITQHDGDLIYTAPVWFDVTSATTAATPLVLTAATAAPAGQGGAQVSFTLSAAAAVDVSITNLAGRPVRRVREGLACAAGINTVLWDGRADSGLTVPAGRYLVNLTARSEAGQQARALTAVNLSR